MRSSRRLTISGDFTISDAQRRRVHHRAHAHGYTDVGQYLAARCRQDASLPQVASELGTTVPVIRSLLAQAGISRPPQPVMTARHRRRATDQRLTQQAARLGFASLEDYLADRVVQQAWPLSQVAGELGTHLRTVRDRLDRFELRRERPTSRQTAGHQRATARRQAHWAAQRQARLNRLGFATLEDYLEERRVRQGWSTGVPPIPRRVGYLAPVGEARVPADSLR